jgi:hypothetical protein
MPCFQNSTYLDTLALIIFFFFHRPLCIIALNWVIWNRAWDFNRQLWWSIKIRFQQIDRRPIHGTLNIIYGWNFVLQHKPTIWINKKSKKMHISMPYWSFKAIF